MEENKLKLKGKNLSFLAHKMQAETA